MARERDIMIKNKWYVASLIIISTSTIMTAFSFWFFIRKTVWGHFFWTYPVANKFDKLFLNEHSFAVSAYQMDWQAPVHQSFFWYDNNKDL